MTYRDLWHRASILFDKGEITLGEYEEMTKPLDREVEQEPFINKPCVSSGVCEHDKNKVLDKLRAEIIERDRNVKAVRSDGCCIFTTEQVLDIIDIYKAESEKK